MDKQKDKIVIDPNTGKQYNCSEIVRKLYAMYQQDSKQEFNRNVDYLNSCIEWDDTIDKQFKKLEDINITEELGQEFKEQLDKIVIYSNRENKNYIPIIDRFKDSYLSQCKEKGISFLCPELDKLTGGIVPGTICTIAGGPGSMKTTTAINIAYQAVKDGKNVCYLTLEETITQLYSKLLSRVSVDINKELNVEDITQHNLTDEESKVLFEEVIPYLSQQKGTFHMIGESDLVSYEFTEIERQLKMIDKYIKDNSDSDHGIDLIIVDHIQLLKYASNTKDEYKVMNEYVSFFRRQALSFLGDDRLISIILLSQVNREGIAYAKKHNGAYLMQHVAEASEVERASSYIISVYTDSMEQISKHLKMGAVKLRNAQLPVDTIIVFADGRYYHAGDTPIPEQNFSYSEMMGESSPPPTTSSIIENLTLDDL